MSPKNIQKLFEGKRSKISIRILGKQSLEEVKKLHEALDKTQIEEAKKDNIVVCGSSLVLYPNSSRFFKLLIYFLQDLANLKVWLEAPLEVRAKITAEKKWKEIYGFDCFNQKKRC